MRHYVRMLPLIKRHGVPKKIAFDMRRSVVATLDECGVDVCCEVHICFTDNDGIRRINSDHRGMNRVTDVLSFPMLDLFPGDEISPEECDVNPETGAVFLGDIVVSATRAREQAELFGHSLEREMVYLTVHSVLHLLGYDHETEEEDAQMREVATKVVEKLNFKLME